MADPVASTSSRGGGEDGGPVKKQDSLEVKGGPAQKHDSLEVETDDASRKLRETCYRHGPPPPPPPPGHCFVEEAVA